LTLLNTGVNVIYTNNTDTHKENIMSVDTKYGEAIFKQTQEFTEMFKAAMPKVTHNKNGYEIRTEVLKLASVSVWKDYYARWGHFEQTVERDANGRVISTTKGPDVPGSKEVLEAAEQFYNFVSGK